MLNNSPAFDHRAQPSVITETQQIEAPAQQLVQPKIFIGKFPPGDTTPSVKNVLRWECINSIAITITNFLKGQEGQEILILGDGNTTIDANVNIQPLGATPHILDANVIYSFILWNGIWLEF